MWAGTAERGGVPQHPLCGWAAHLEALSKETSSATTSSHDPTSGPHLATSGCRMRWGHVREEAALGAGAAAGRAGTSWEGAGGGKKRE